MSDPLGGYKVGWQDEKPPPDPLEGYTADWEKQARPTAAVATPAAVPTPRFPENQPRYDRFGEPVNEAARDVESAQGATRPPAFPGPPIRTARTAGLGLALGAGHMILGVPGAIERGFEVAGAPFAEQEMADIGRGRGRPPSVTGPSPGVEAAQALNPLPMVERAVGGDPEAIGGFLAMPFLGRMGDWARGPDFTVRGAPGPEAAEAFRTLGLDPQTATPADVDAAFRRAAKRTHPDVAAEDRVARGGPADPIVAAQEFAKADAAREVARKAAQGRTGQPVGTEEQFYRRQQEAKQKPTAPQGPPAGIGPVPTPETSAARAMTDEQLAAHPLGQTPPVAESAAGPGGEARTAAAGERITMAERRKAGVPVDVERRAGAPPPVAAPPVAPVAPQQEIAPSAGVGQPQAPTTAPERVTDDELHNALHASFGAAPRWDNLRERGATDVELREAIGRELGAREGGRLFVQGVGGQRLQGAKLVSQARELLGVPDLTDEQATHYAMIRQEAKPLQQERAQLLERQQKATDPAEEATIRARIARVEDRLDDLMGHLNAPWRPGMPARPVRAAPEPATAVEPAAGAPHDQAAVQEGLFGEKTLAGKEQTELMPETAGVPTQKLKGTKVGAEEVGRVKREGAEPEGERPAPLFPPVSAAAARATGVTPESLQAAVRRQLMPDLEAARREVVDARVRRDKAAIAAAEAKVIALENRMWPGGGTPVEPGASWRAAVERADFKMGGPAPEKPLAFRKTKTMTPDEQVARHAELSARLARDQQIMGAGTYETTFEDVGGHIGWPGQKFTRTVSKGPAYAARGRIPQTEKLLKTLEAQMSPETLARAKARSTEVGNEAAARQNRADYPSPDYERLARMTNSTLGADLRKATIDKLIDYGSTREELEGMTDRDLAQEALKSGVLDAEHETKLLDVVMEHPEAGAIRGKPITPAPVAKRTGVVDRFLQLASPQSRGPEVREAAESYLKEYGEMVRRNDVANYRVKGYRGKVDLRTPQGIEFMDRAERGLGQVAKHLDELARIAHEENDLRGDLVQDADPDALRNRIENYMGRVWLKDRQAPTDLMATAARLAARRPLAGTKGFLKPRLFDYYVDGVAAGKVPATPDAVDMMKLKWREHDLFIMATRWRRDLLSRGLRKFYKAGAKAGTEPGDIPEGWVPEPEGDVWYRTEAKQLVKAGSYYVPEPIAQLEHNVLGPGVFKGALVDAWNTLNNTLTAAILGYSGFHGYMTTMTSAFSRAALGWNRLTGGDLMGVADIVAGTMVAPALTRNLLDGLALRSAWKNPNVVNPAMQHLASLLARSGGGFETPHEYIAAAIAGVKEAVANGHLPVALGRAAALAIRSGTIPILEHYVPLIKYGAWADGARLWLKQHPMASDAETNRALQELRYQIDNRFGQVRYDTRFWNQTMKQILHATFFAPGWVAGSAEMVTNALRDIGQGRFRSWAVMGLLGMVTATATINAIYNLYATGEAPQSLQDVIEPRDGTFDEFGNPNRISPATYFKVYAAWFRAARHLARGEPGGGFGPVPSGLRPGFHLLWELLQNRDFTGNLIRNPQDPWAKQFQQAAKFVAGDWEPISVRNVEEMRRRGEKGIAAFKPALGMTPASREAVRTPAQNLLFQMMREHAGARTPEQLEGAQAKREAFPQTGDQRLVSMFRKLSPDARAQVFAIANEHEQALWQPYVARRRFARAR